MSARHDCDPAHSQGCRGGNTAPSDAFKENRAAQVDCLAPDERVLRHPSAQTAADSDMTETLGLLGPNRNDRRTRSGSALPGHAGKDGQIRTASPSTEFRTQDRTVAVPEGAFEASNTVAQGQAGGVASPYSRATLRISAKGN